MYIKTYPDCDAILWSWALISENISSQYFRYLVTIFQICISQKQLNAKKLTLSVVKNVWWNEDNAIVKFSRNLQYEWIIFGYAIHTAYCKQFWLWITNVHICSDNKIMLMNFVQGSKWVVGYTPKISPVGDWWSTSLEWPWPWPWYRPYGIPSCITHRPLPTYQISLRSEEEIFWNSPLRFWSSSESRDTKTRINIRNPARSNLDIVL